MRADVELLNTYKFLGMTFEQIMRTREKILGNVETNYILQNELVNIETEEENRKLRFTNLLNHIDNENF